MCLHVYVYLMLLFEYFPPLFHNSVCVNSTYEVLYTNQVNSLGFYPKVNIIPFDKHYPYSLEQASWSVFLVWSYMVGSPVPLLPHFHFSCVFFLPFNLFPYVYRHRLDISWQLGPLWMNKQKINGQLVEILHVVALGNKLCCQSSSYKTI